MVKLLSSLLAGAFVSRADQSCRAHDGECTGLDKPSLGASQLQVAASSAGSRGYVSEFGSSQERESEALDFENAMSSSLSSGRMLHSAAAKVREAEQKMRGGYSPSVNEIDHLISGFDGDVSSSYDQCSTELHELKQQLSIISQEVTSITVEVNSVESSIYSYEEACKEKTTEISIIEKKHVKNVQKCVTEKNTVKKTLSTLHVDLVDMKQISAAHIHVSTGSGNGGYSGGGGYGGQSTGIGGGYGGVSSGGVSHTSSYTGGSTSIGGGYGGISHTSGYNGGTSIGGGYGGGVSSTGVSHTSGYSVSGGHSVSSSGISHTSGYNGGTSIGGGYSSGISHTSGYNGGISIGGGYGGVSSGHGGYGYRRMSLLERASQSKPDLDEPADNSPEGRQRRVDKVQSLVQQTREMAQKANQCMAAAKAQAPQADDVGEGANTAEVFLEIDQETNDTAKSGYSPPPNCGPMPADCYHAKCVNGKWQCSTMPEPCSGPMPVDCDVKCVNGKWTCGTSPVLPTECQEVVIELEHTFTVSYVSLTRLIEEYEVTVHSTVCEDTEEVEYNKEVTVVQTEATKVCKRVQVYITNLHQYQLQLQQTTSTKVTIEKNLQVLTTQCGSLTETSNYLEQVTGTIIALGNCPGLGDLSFKLPTYVGSWVYVKQQQGMTDADLDALMLQTCKQAFSKYGNSVRPAEVSELDESSIQNMPSTNTATSPLLGACPMCEGDDSDYGHGRICWDQAQYIGPDSKRGDCNVGNRAVLCVYEPSGQSGGAY